MGKDLTKTFNKSTLNKTMESIIEEIASIYTENPNKFQKNKSQNLELETTANLQV